VLHGNVGAVDRLDFTVIGPALNEVVRMEKLCEPLGQQILFSSRFAEAAGRCDGRLESLGHFQLRGVDEAKEIFGLGLNGSRRSSLTAINQITYAFGPGVVGLLHDLSGGYALPFYGCIGLELIAAALIMIRGKTSSLRSNGSAQRAAR
jgi:hypothetical protein